jgi:pyruvate/2-oxoglutarate dehydrogenase complex dihydrolipoamide acyltransferase (E2) component
MAEIKVPELAESISEGTIAQWLKQPGDYVEQGEYLLELETDKVNVELTAEESGVLKEVLKDSGDTVQVGEIIGTITEGAGESSAPAPSESAPAKEQTKEEAKAEPAAQEVSQEAQSEAKSRTVASPAARKLAREKGIDLSQIPTGTRSAACANKTWKLMKNRLQNLRHRRNRRLKKHSKALTNLLKCKKCPAADKRSRNDWLKCSRLLRC